MVESFVELLKNNVSGYIVIAFLFAWFFFHTSKKDTQREERLSRLNQEREVKLMSHNEKYQDILVKQSDIIQEQGILLDRLRESMDKQSEQLGRVALIVDSIGSETERMRKQLTKLEERVEKNKSAS